MKKNILSFVLTPVFLLTFCLRCDNSRTTRNELESLMEKRDSLLQVNSNKDTFIHHLSDSFDEIEANLTLIHQKEGSLKIHIHQAGDITDKRQKINKSINEINDLMTRNTNRINILNDQVKRAKVNNQELNRLVAVLVEHIMAKNEDLISLNVLLNKKDNQLTALGSNALSLTAEIKAQGDTIDAQHKALSQANAELSTAFLLMGSLKELKAKHVFDAHGKLVPDFNKDYFTQIDTRQEIFIPDDRPSPKEIMRVLTSHPSNSYEFVKNDQGKRANLKIKNREEFWRTSRYLILETN